MYYFNRVKWAVVFIALGLALWCTWYFTARTNRLIKQDQAAQLFELDPGMAIAYYQRGAAYSRLGNVNQSCSDMRTAARLGFALAGQWLEEHRTSSP